MKEFKKFISRGNVVDLAVGLILATYFGAIVKSLVNDVIMPPVGLLLGGIDFSEFKVVIKEAQPGAAEVAINYGIFINTILTFLIVGFAIFILVKMYNKTKERLLKEEEAQTAPAPPSKEEVLLTEIRDLLKK
ncbi:MAG: large-conductance mechanosensitive channel protein MscL [Flavobacteriaceae bacterium]